VPWALRNYELQLKTHQTLNDDSVPFVNLTLTTGFFSAAFGCSFLFFPESTALTEPIVRTPAEADRLPLPGLNCRPFDRYFELVALVRQRLGPEASISVPDMQSPFDIAALVCDKTNLLAGLHETPEAVKRLVDKCRDLLILFLRELKRINPACSMCHYPVIWAPPESGCFVSEDEAGSMSSDMFKEFCLPGLTTLSQTFGGLSVHCCADADHQYPNFMAIPNFRGFNRCFPKNSPGPVPAFRAFGDKTVFLLNASFEGAHQYLDQAFPDNRFLFSIEMKPTTPLDKVQKQVDTLRSRCEGPLHGAGTISPR